MKRRKQIIWLAAAAVFVGTSLFFLLHFYPEAIGAGMMGNGHKKGMRETMQETMADVLPPGIDPSLLPEPKSKGARLLQRYCTQCHYLSGPGRHTAEEWPAVIERMKTRFAMHRQMMGDIAVPTESEFKMLTDYLQTYAQKPIDVTRYSDLDTAAGQSFTTTCSRCHVTPDPKQHTAQEWPAVVRRMQKHIFTMHKTVANEATLKRILAFLQRHGRTQH